jgi:hypothetical protein
VPTLLQEGRDARSYLKCEAFTRMVDAWVENFPEAEDDEEEEEEGEEEEEEEECVASHCVLAAF